MSIINEHVQDKARELMAAMQEQDGKEWTHCLIAFHSAGTDTAVVLFHRRNPDDAADVDMNNIHRMALAIKKWFANVFAI